MKVSITETAKLLQRARNVVITGHINPDGDSLGSMLALGQGLKLIDKKVTLLLDDELPALYNFLPGITTIAKPTGKQVDIDLLVILDASDEERVGKVLTWVDAPILNIDHHVSNTRFADYYLVDAAAAATGELVLRLLEQLEINLNPEMALCLYTAIATDCGFFRYANTTADTFRMAAQLLDCGVQPHIVSESLDTRPLANLTALITVLQTLEFYNNGAIGVITIPEAISEAVDTEGFINYPRNISGVEVAVMLKLLAKQDTRVSLRSKNLNVSLIAQKFGGGGHARAAGFSIAGEYTKVKNVILAAIIQAMESSW